MTLESFVFLHNLESNSVFSVDVRQPESNLLTYILNREYKKYYSQATLLTVVFQGTKRFCLYTRQTTFSLKAGFQ